eukprot:8766573-Prorocentrum_lima.AAC.1
MLSYSSQLALHEQTGLPSGAAVGTTSPTLEGRAPHQLPDAWCVLCCKDRGSAGALPAIAQSPGCGLPV